MGAAVVGPVVRCDIGAIMHTVRLMGCGLLRWGGVVRMRIDTALAATFVEQLDIRETHTPIQTLAHVVHRETRHRDRGQDQDQDQDAG